MKKDISPLLGRILEKIAPKVGAKVILEPKWNVVGQIAFKNGRKRYFRYNSLDLNTLGASEISKDKGFATFFMEQMGFSVVEGKAFYSKSWAQAIGSRDNIFAAFNYAKKLGFPVIVKPNSGTQGAGVTKVYNKKEFFKALNFIFKKDRVALVQRVVTGKDYRVVVLDNKVISAYERVPLNVVGDGVNSIKKLLLAKQKRFLREGRDTQINLDDFRIVQKLKHQGLSLGSVLKKYQKIFLLDNANLSGGGDALDVTAHMHPEFKKISISLTKNMGLRLCGVDLIIDGEINHKPAKYWILETNAAPGLDHYVLTGKKQEKIVEQMYLEVLKAME